MNNKGADQTVRMHRLICAFVMISAFVIRIWQKQVFSWRGSYSIIQLNCAGNTWQEIHFSFICAHVGNEEIHIYMGWKFPLFSINLQGKNLLGGIWQMSRVMRLWYFLSSVNSFFKHACAAIQWGYMSEFWSDPLSTSILHVCEQRRLKTARMPGSPEPSLPPMW